MAATGELKNHTSVLSKKQIERLDRAKNNYTDPEIIVTQKEAEVNEKTKSNSKKTWVFEAENVRDFGWASSRKFIWDAMAVDIAGKRVMAYSY